MGMHTGSRRAGAGIADRAAPGAGHGAAYHRRDWRRAMSDHVATALIVYTGMQIFVTVKAMAAGLPSILPYLALVVLIAAIIPGCRWFEKRWQAVGDDHAHDPALAPAFRRDVAVLWALAIGLPIVLTLLFKMLFAAA